MKMEMENQRQNGDVGDYVNGDGKLEKKPLMHV